MSTIFILLAILFACLLAVGSFIGYRMRRRLPFANPLPVTPSLPRQLTPEERIAVEHYLAQENSQTTTPLDTPTDQPKLPRSLQSNRVYPITHTITRYGLSTDAQTKWRYYIDTQEIHLPPNWEQYITENNTVELIKTRSIPLVISLNGHSLAECVDNRQVMPAPEIPMPNASIRQEEHEHAELVTIRKETREEHAIHHSAGLKEAGVLCLAFLLLLISLNSPIALLPWLTGSAALLAAWSVWQLFRSPSEQELRDVHCLHGTPQSLGLFGESNQGQFGNISLGNIDLIYPPHWQPYISLDLGRKTDVDIYLNRQVVRQGEHLSLHDEVKNFPLQRWGKNLLLAAGSLFSLILLLTYVPLELPLKLSMAWIQGAQHIQVTQVDELEKIPLKIGDALNVQGSGMCYVPSGIHPASSNSPPHAFTPFDCSAIYWNKADPLPLPESDIIEKTSALLNAVNSQLHPQTDNEGQVNSQLATAIQKSGMILLNDFSEIVLKTQELCEQERDCTRLKNALINLGNVKNWDTLVKQARSGSLKGMNVLLRPVSAETLESLVNSSTDFFFYQEINNAADLLNSPPPGGFLIRSDEGRQFVSHPLPLMPLHEYRPSDQWQELQRLSAMLLHTPFNASGVITHLSTDANGTQHIGLHSEPDVITLWRYLGSCLLLLIFSATLIANAVLLGIKVRKSRQRVTHIQHYYAQRFGPAASPPPLLDNRMAQP
ncbi:MULTISPECIES: intracellular growth attenuator family protein [unclassified Brenneria]|uniref:intracellular growth attenuator family protein n=1 Tax=unclassified Brenneria TaxID=2634434 RepID=UPI0015529594|nr:MULTISPECIES: intracellular growth attenuator family protein [unclassified Brenneria]MBJ7222975.1 intracellular growth attenuator family protein [Brenneria sp. L3-3C-1]MEE3644214.1 intracellular growth attenuator family protein [Brenneria sp. L3_3C_1]MEE3652438.1 intracellular growth attenuator family protein [Brenneria sp. HEZEL_4_2_4]NPD02395.1 intracellular growth attenuator family protein [Brenneria sp. hezel4-2-4]